MVGFTVRQRLFWAAWITLTILAAAFVLVGFTLALGLPTCGCGG